MLIFFPCANACPYFSHYRASSHYCFVKNAMPPCSRFHAITYLYESAIAAHNRRAIHAPMLSPLLCKLFAIVDTFIMISACRRLIRAPFSARALPPHGLFDYNFEPLCSMLGASAVPVLPGFRHFHSRSSKHELTAEYAPCHDAAPRAASLISFFAHDHQPAIISPSAREIIASIYRLGLPHELPGYEEMPILIAAFRFAHSHTAISSATMMPRDYQTCAKAQVTGLLSLLDAAMRQEAILFIRALSIDYFTRRLFACAQPFNEVTS